MTAEERMAAYIHSLDRGNGAFLEELYLEARRDRVPVIRRETQSLLKTLLVLHRPARILEIGTAIGFSSILMARANPVYCRIVTIENYEKRIRAARENIRRAGLENQITIAEGDAAVRIRELADPFDFILLDAAKGQYIRYLPDLKRLMAEGGVLLADNVLQGGDILESRFAVERRNRTIHSRMREFLRAVTSDEELQASVLPVGDGVVLAVKKGKIPDAENKRSEETGIADPGLQPGGPEGCGGIWR